MALLCNGSASSANTTGLMAACIGPPSLGIAAVQGGAPQFTAGTSTITYNFAAAQNAGDAIVVFVSGNLATGTPSSIADTSGNSYTQVTSTDSADFVCYVALNVKAASAGANTVTATLSGAATFACLSAVEYRPSPGNTLSIIDQNFASATGATSSSSQTFSPQYCCEMAINCVVARNTTAPVGESGWTTEGTGTDGLFQGMLYQDQIQTTRSNLTITATGLGSISYASLAIGIAINAAPPTSLGTVTCFAYLPTGSTSGAFWHICDPGIGDGDGWIGQNTTTPGLQINNPNGTDPTAKTVLTKQWYFLSARISATEISQTACAVGSGSDLVAAIVAAGQGAFAPAAFAMGIDLLLSGNGGSALNSQGFLTGSIAGLKVWTNGAWLSDAELVAESSQLAAVRQADLWAGMKFQGEGNNLNLVVEEGMAAGLTFAKLGTNQVSFAPDPPIPRVKQYRDWGLKKSSNTAVAFAVAIVGQATVTDAINVARALTDAIVGGATLTEAIKATRALAASVAGSSAVTDRIAVTRALKDAVSGAGTVGGAVAVKRALADAVGAHASVAASAKLARALIDATHGTSTYAATSVIARAMLDAIEAGATLDASIDVARHVALAAEGTASAAWSVAATRKLALTADGHATMVGGLTASRPLAIVVDGAALTTFDLEIPGGPVALAVAIAGQATAEELMRVARALAAAVDANATLGALMGVTRHLGLTAHGDARFTPALGNLRPVVVSVDGVAACTLTPKFQRGLSVRVAGGASLTAAIARAAGLALPVHGQATMTAEIARATSLALAVEGVGDLLAALFLGTGPIGPMRIDAGDGSVVTLTAWDQSPYAVSAWDEPVNAIGPADSPALAIDARDGATLTIIAWDSPPT